MKIFDVINWPIAVVSLLLVSIGLLVIYSSSPELAIQQLVFTITGIFFFLFISQLDLYGLKGFIKPLFYFTNILLITVLIIGIETRGSLRWLPLGFFNLQPSELAKPILILLLALFWVKHPPSWMNILKSFLWAAPFLFLVFKQPDLGTAMTIMAIWVGMLFASQISAKKVLILLLVATLIIPSGWLLLHPYQKQRIIGFLTPDSDPLGRGYNLIQSTIAVGSGGFLGRGLGRGTQSRLQFLPEFRTDFIFASIAEELGFLGSFVILALYFYLLTLCLKSANQAEDRLDYLLIFGVFSMLLFQIFVNVGMNMGLLPITGITLPLISYGGSSLIVTFISLGIVASVAKNQKRL